MLPHPEPGNNRVGPIKWEAVEFSLFRVSDVAFRVTLWSSFVFRKMKQTVHEALNPEPRTQKPRTEAPGRTPRMGWLAGSLVLPKRATRDLETRWPCLCLGFQTCGYFCSSLLQTHKYTPVAASKARSML